MSVELLVPKVAIVAGIVVVSVLLNCLKLVEKLFVLEFDRITVALATFGRWLVESTSQRDELFVVRIVEFGELTHTIAVYVLAVRDAVIFVLIALSLILRLLVVFFFIIASLVE